MIVDDSIARLVEQARRHEHEAFAELLTLSLPMARALCSRLLPDGGDVDDVLQEACLQAWLGLEGLQRPERFRQWLTGIALNLARMRIRGRRPSLPLEIEPRRSDESVEALIEADELRRALAEALGSLPDLSRITIAAFYFDGRSLPEISAATGTPVGTLKARLSRARQSLRSALVTTPTAPPEMPTMIEVVVQSVLTQEPPSEPARQSRVLVLAEKDGARLLPIWIGPMDGDFLAFQLSGHTPPRPLTLNLLAQILSITGTTLEQVAINRLHDEVFYATLALTVGGQPQAVDARPSDAVNLALLKGVPIFVATEILDSQGKTPDALQAHLTEAARLATTDPVTWASAVPPDWPKAK